MTGILVGRDFVTGFHKRKKKRRKEAQKILQEKERKKRIEDRKRVRNLHTSFCCNVVTLGRCTGCAILF